MITLRWILVSNQHHDRKRAEFGQVGRCPTVLRTVFGSPPNAGSGHVMGRKIGANGLTWGTLHAVRRSMTVSETSSSRPTIRAIVPAPLAATRVGNHDTTLARAHRDDGAVHGGLHAAWRRHSVSGRLPVRNLYPGEQWDRLPRAMPKW